MKVSGSMSWADISASIAGDIKHTTEKKRKQASTDQMFIISEEDTKSEAKQSAIAYWTMGWSWDEIEAVLEDAEYPQAAINYAMKEAKSYAREILNNGPFTTVRTGNLLCLKNGYVCQFNGADSDGVHVRVVGSVNKKGHDPSFELVVSSDDLDKDASKKLAKAYELEKKADLILESLEKTAMKKSAGLQQFDKKSVLDTPVNKVMSVVSAVVDTSLKFIYRVDGSNVHGTRAAALSRDRMRVEALYNLVKKVNADLTYLYNADLEDGNTPEECVNTINAAVKKFVDYVSEHVATLQAEYGSASDNVLNATSASRYDAWDGPMYADLLSASQELSGLVEAHKEYVQVKSTSRLFSDRR